jgi:excisionase family DNA binding protein
MAEAYGPWLRQRKVAKLLDVSLDTVDAWRRAGEIGYSQVRRSIRIPRSEVDRLLAENFVERTKKEEEKLREEKQFRYHDRHPAIHDGVRRAGARSKNKTSRNRQSRAEASGFGGC